MSPKPPSARLAIFLISIGGFCVLSGVLLAILRVLEPDKTALPLPVTETPTLVMPTIGMLANIDLEPPPLQVDNLPQIMPVMEVVVQSPRSTPQATNTVNPTATPTATEIPFSPTKRPTTTHTVPPSSTHTQQPLPTNTISPSATPEPFTSTPWPTLSTEELSTIPPIDSLLASENLVENSEGVPTYLEIPQINLVAPINPVGWHTTELSGNLYSQWDVPQSYASGWHNNSAVLGERGNTVLNGHHNAWGHVFKDLVDVEAGAEIIVSSGEEVFHYTVVQTMILPEKDQSIEVRLDNARWLLPSQDERVTLVTCWPFHDNTHRLVIVALPTDSIHQWQQPESNQNLPEPDNLEIP